MFMVWQKLTKPEIKYNMTDRKWNSLTGNEKLTMKTNKSVDAKSIMRCVHYTCNSHGSWSLVTPTERQNSLTARNGGSARPEDCCAQEGRSGPPSADQGFSTAKPRSSHVTWAQGWNPLTSPCPTLSAGIHVETKSQGLCRKWHHKLKVVWCIYASIAYNRLIGTYS